MNPSDYIFITLESLQQPFDGAYCLADRWWMVNDNNEALIYIRKGAYSPQCNHNRSVTERIGAANGLHPVLIPFAYIDAGKYFGN